MDLRKYVKEIFTIGHKSETPIDLHICQAMFEANLRLQKEEYPGTGELDYVALGAEWNGLPTGERQKASNQCSNYINYWYFQLVDLIAGKIPDDQKEWDVAEKLVVAPQQGQKIDGEGMPGVWSKREQNAYKEAMVKKIREELHPTEG